MTFEEKLEIGNIEYWFAKYDLQVKEYERAVRLGLTANIHIGDKMYTTIEELDAEAEDKAKRLKELTNEVIK